MRYIYLTVILASLLVAGCGSLPDRSDERPSTGPKRTETVPPKTPMPAESPSEADGRSAESALGSAEARRACYETDTGDNVVLRSQTFAINFEPFTDSCFVTSHNPEFDDPPMESEIGIYKDGSRVYDFPSQFNGATFGCWVDAVAFQDLNDDASMDIIVIGKCSGKSATYNENMVYVNTGREFTTDAEANLKASDHETIATVSRFVRQNKRLFFK